MTVSLNGAPCLGVIPLAVVVGHSTHAQQPGLFTTAPVGAIQKLFDKTGWNATTVHLYEINEAFAVVTMAAMHEHKLPHEKVMLQALPVWRIRVALHLMIACPSICRRPCGLHQRWLPQNQSLTPWQLKER